MTYFPLGQIDALEDAEVDEISDWNGEDVTEAFDDLRTNPIMTNCPCVGKTSDDSLHIGAGDLLELELLYLFVSQVLVSVGEDVQCSVDVSCLIHLIHSTC